MYTRILTIKAAFPKLVGRDKFSKCDAHWFTLALEGQSANKTCGTPGRSRDVSGREKRFS
jgi:hypothetical protein